ncbi:hypothetical protein MAR_000014 [Mya arenaria]|uniref:Uncharacterized protein n=1 Tax=Mya arenaria TaxID=6604 RepID=A0ABY7FG14_MYAAR|nr:hypothetical protein MAR_000014 [Mya arenaria]
MESVNIPAGTPSSDCKLKPSRPIPLLVWFCAKPPKPSLRAGSPSHMKSSRESSEPILWLCEFTPVSMAVQHLTMTRLVQLLDMVITLLAVPIPSLVRLLLKVLVARLRLLVGHSHTL